MFVIQTEHKIKLNTKILKYIFYIGIRGHVPYNETHTENSTTQF